MSADALISSMEKLLKLHKSLYKLAVKKTETVKQGDMETLNKLLQDEKFHIAAIGKMEKERQSAALQLIPEQESPTVMECLKTLTGKEHGYLLELANQLAETVFDLKEQNYLNQQLIYQSLQFVNVSMNLLNPQSDSFNYGPPTEKNNRNKIPQGIFNSQA